MVWTRSGWNLFYQPFGIGTARHCAGKSDQLGATTAHQHHIGNRHPPLAALLLLPYCIGARVDPSVSVALTTKWKLYSTTIMVHQEQINLSTKSWWYAWPHWQVNQIVKNSGIETGMAHVFNIGSTAAIGTILFEPGLQRDLPEIKLIPPSPWMDTK